MPDDRLEVLLARLTRERDEADRSYNEALTALDRALDAPVDFPHPPPSYDVEKLPDVNRAWDILPNGAPPIDGSLKGRLRAFIWRLVGPAFETQKHFNAALVDHLNRNVAAHQESAKATASAIAMMQQRHDAIMRFQSHLIRYLQTLTLYVDTRDRAAGSQALVVNAGLSALTDDWLKRWESLRTRETRLLARVDTVAASIDDVRATAAAGQQAALTLKRELEAYFGTAGPAGTAGTRTATAAPTSSDAAPEANDAPHEPGRHQVPAVPAVPVVPTPDLNAFKYLSFEDAFRGSQELISARLAEYVPLFEGQSDVLDIGCGRGEFLDLLRARGIDARGLDLNHAMVMESRARGLNVAEGDALGYLHSLPDASLGGLFAAQVVEHLQPDYLSALLEVAGHKLRPGALIVLETINPACWLAFFESYIRDLTHVRPLHPETLQHLLRVNGFTDLRTEYKSPVAESTRLATLPPALDDTSPVVVDLIDTFNDNMRKLNARMFTFQDYAAIGVRR